MRLNTLLGSLVSLSLSALSWLMRMLQIETTSSDFAKKRKITLSRSTDGQTPYKRTNEMSRILDPDWSQFKYVPAAKTDLRESMERYKRMVSVSSSRTVHTGTKEASNGKTDRGVLLDLTELRQKSVQNSGKRNG
jgi:hypothetical protein